MRTSCLLCSWHSQLLVFLVGSLIAWESVDYERELSSRPAAWRAVLAGRACTCCLPSVPAPVGELQLPASSYGHALASGAQVAEAERDLNDAQHKADAAKQTYEVR